MGWIMGSTIGSTMGWIMGSTMGSTTMVFPVGISTAVFKEAGKVDAG